MSEFTVPAKFLFWAASVIAALGLLGSIGKLTTWMGTAAVETQQHDQLSYGSFSRKLWPEQRKH